MLLLKHLIFREIFQLNSEFTLLNEMEEFEVGLVVGDSWCCWWVATLALLDLGEFYKGTKKLTFKITRGQKYYQCSPQSISW